MPMTKEKWQQEQRADQGEPLLWIAADYHFPYTYSCRIPMSSNSSALAMPAPGPATVRLALIRTGIELFGLETTREKLFPILRSMEVRVRPPERVAISQHTIRAYKRSGNKQKGETIQESITTREMAHASGPMRLYLRIPASGEQDMRALLQAIGYWGQSSSLTSCLHITQTPPIPGEYAIPLVSLTTSFPLQPFFSCLATEFSSRRLLWYDIVPEEGSPKRKALQLDIYVWPMVIDYRHGTQKLLVRVPLREQAHE
jgi:hypothetical protein